MVIFTNQNTHIKEGFLHFPKSTRLPPIKTRITEYQQIRLIPQAFGYRCEIVYNYQEQDLKLNKEHVLGLDLGLTNLITAVNNQGLAPFIIKGGIVKSVNQYFNKTNAELQSLKDNQNYGFQTKHQQRLLQKRNDKITDFFHKASRYLIEYCIAHDLGTIVIGYNEGWKQAIELGKRTNQNFVQLPFAELVSIITYKAKMVGIIVIIQEESYTSKCSFPDNESIEYHAVYLGHRIHRGLFCTHEGKIINADVNGALNIVKKAIPTAFAQGIEGVVLRPLSVNVIQKPIKSTRFA